MEDAPPVLRYCSRNSLWVSYHFLILWHPQKEEKKVVLCRFSADWLHCLEFWEIMQDSVLANQCKSSKYWYAQDQIQLISMYSSNFSKMLNHALLELARDQFGLFLIGYKLTVKVSFSYNSLLQQTDTTTKSHILFSSCKERLSALASWRQLFWYRWEMQPFNLYQSEDPRLYTGRSSSASM